MQSSKRQLQSRSFAKRSECLGLVEAGVAQTRRPKGEVRKQPEIRNPKSGIPTEPSRLESFGFLPSDFLRPSTFGLRSSTPAFTLIEIMIVVGIMGIILTMGVPIVYRATHKAPLGKALADIVEVCSNARARAILGGHQVDIVFHPRDGRLEVGSAAAPPPANPLPLGMPDATPPAPAPGSGLSAQLGDGVVIRALGINMVDFTDAESARVRFFPNGTCDEMLMVINTAQNEQRGISLEITTALASVLSEAELQQLRERLR